MNASFKMNLIAMLLVKNVLNLRKLIELDIGNLLTCHHVDVGTLLINWTQPLGVGSSRNLSFYIRIITKSDRYKKSVLHTPLRFMNVTK